MYAEYSLEKAKAVADLIMRSWFDTHSWPENETYQIGQNWKMHLFTWRDGKRHAVLYELNENGDIITKSKTSLPIPTEVQP